MSYNTIINPETNRKVNLSTPLGKKIIKNYVNHLVGGSYIIGNLFGGSGSNIKSKTLKKLQNQLLEQKKHTDCLSRWHEAQKGDNVMDIGDPFDILQCMKDYYCETFNKGQGKLSASEKIRLNSYIRYVASFDNTVNDKDLVNMKSSKNRGLVCDKLQATIDYMKSEKEDKDTAELAAAYNAYTFTDTIEQEKTNKIKVLVKDLIKTHFDRPIEELLIKILLAIGLLFDPELSNKASEFVQFGGSANNEIKLKDIVNVIYNATVNRTTATLGLTLATLYNRGGWYSILNAVSSINNMMVIIGPVFFKIATNTGHFYNSWDIVSGLKKFFSRFSVSAILTLIIWVISSCLADIGAPHVEKMASGFSNSKMASELEMDTSFLENKAGINIAVTLAIMSLIYQILNVFKWILWKVEALPEELEYEDTSEFDKSSSKIWENIRESYNTAF